MLVVLNYNFIVQFKKKTILNFARGIHFLVPYFALLMMDSALAYAITYQRNYEVIYAIVLNLNVNILHLLLSIELDYKIHY